jgi:glycosyltransferase involved in cell wall biosynthesis
MREADLRSIRLLVDLQACQTAGSAKRGVGRYSQALFEAMAAAAQPRQLFGLLGAQHSTVPELNKFPRSRLLWSKPLPDFKTGRFYLGGEQDSIDSCLYNSVSSAISPDIIHVSHVFEGFGERVAVPRVLDRPPGQVISATLYDLIPLRFPDHYFRSPEFKRWYHNRLSFYHQADLLLAISEASRRDAIELLGLAPEKIVTILGGVSKHFRPVADRSARKAELLKQYGLARPGIILYAGGDDHRKNLKGAIEAFAQIPEDLRKKNQLVVICAMEAQRQEYFRSIAQKIGLLTEDVHFVGFVSEEDLVGFYSVCDVFFFPSLYEGLGFPVIEAMACGAPVLCGNNSSLVELVDRQDAQFDSSVPQSIAQKLTAALADTGFAEDLRRYGRERARNFDWDVVARRALDAFDDALARKRTSLVAAAFSSVLPKTRMAMLTPLPPCKSGIADYNAQFLPYLSEHFDIDLFVDGYACSEISINSAFRIFDAQDFRKTAAAYDVILYEFGNSEYHNYMLQLLEEFPGVVGLHDAYLSGMIGHVSGLFGKRGREHPEWRRFPQEMLYSHGSGARRHFAPVQANPDAIGAAMIDLPCTKRVIDQAIGVISHSRFNLQLAHQLYPQGWLAPYRIIPQMIRAHSLGNPIENKAFRTAKGFGEDDFIITTFGHIAWNKCGDRLLKAFVRPELAGDRRVHLVFAGELAKDSFGLSLENSIQKSGLRDRIRITEYLSEEDYKSYLRISDVAVQLRMKSRGGTPRGVLDCMSNGLPVVLNNEASYEDYPDDVVVKLSANPEPEEIAAAIARLQKNPDLRKMVGDRGNLHVRKHHDPSRIAAEYAGAIHEFMARHEATKVGQFIRGIAPHLTNLPDTAVAAELASTYFEARPRPSFSRPRLIIDVSHIAQSDHGTGIPRVVRETVRAAYCSPRKGFEAIAVQRSGDEIVPAIGWLDQQKLLLPHEVETRDIAPIEFANGDHLLMLDSSWAEFAKFAPVFSAARLARVPVTTAIYDLLPITLPAGNIVEGGRAWFEKWLHSAIASSDGLVCISKSVADELIDFITGNKLARAGLKVGWWHLGSDLPTKSEPDKTSQVRNLSNTLFCLMVGTIEPRKNHALVLDAFELIWAGGSDLKLVIAGKPGWLVDDLMQRMRSHSELGKRLFIFDAPADAEISFLYKKAALLLFVSKGEGFGLPLVEAAHYGTPIVCSRIPSFVEITQENAIYVGIDSPQILATEIAGAWKQIQARTAPNSNAINRLSWEQSTEQLLKVVIDDNWYWSG